MNAAPIQEGPRGRKAQPSADDEPGWPDGEGGQAAEEFDAGDEPDAEGEAAAAPGPRRSSAAGGASDIELAAWIDAIVDRDERALAALYDATFSRVYGIVYRVVRRAALAEEVVEDTFFQVWRQAPRFDPARGAPINWLLAMARSRAIDAIRREARFVHDSLDSSEASAVADDSTPGDELLDVARHHAELHRALMQLGAQPRQLVSLAFLRGLSHEEIAAHTRLPLGTVKSQIRRALITLRQILGDGILPALAC